MDTIEVTEKQRRQLEESVTKLRKALRHWQIHSAEYEGLKEELLLLPRTAGRNKILAIADDFGGDVVTREEITSFLGDKEGIKRGPAQVAEAVRHRIDYIQGNIDKIEKQLELGEATLDNVRVIENSGQLTNEEGLPVMDIREDLDERGVVIKSDVNPAHGGSAKPFNVTAAIESFQPLVDTLSKKQKEKEKEEPTKSQEKSKDSSAAPPKPTSSKPLTAQKKPPSKDHIQQKQKPQAQPKTPKRIQSTEKEYSTQTGMILTEKRVKAKLVPDLKEEAPQPAPKEEISVKEIVTAVPEAADYMVTPEQGKSDVLQKEGIARIRVLDDSEDDEDLDEDSEDLFKNLPAVEESEEDAQMREEMIKYNMREMNNIVAEIELEEGDDDDDDDDDYDDEEDDENDDDEDEDQWGRSKGRLVSDKVRREMMILQKKIEARDKAAQVAAEVGEDLKVEAVSAKEKTETGPTEQPKKEKKKSSEKKGVRFAEDLDIAPTPTPISKPPSNASQLVRDEFDDEDIDPSILDMIFGPGTKDQEAQYFQNTTDQPKKKLPSLFKAARQVQKAKEQAAIEKAPPAVSGVVEKAQPPPGSYEIIERTPSTATPTAPKPSSKMPTRKTAPSSKSKQKEQTPPVAAAPTTLDPLGAELSDEERPIMASSVIERAPTWETSSNIERKPPTAPDELDPDFHQREVTNAYYAMRNKLIQRQGGFVETEEEKTEVPIDENLEKRKVSRFKAGRVKNQIS